MLSGVLFFIPIISRSYWPHSLRYLCTGQACIIPMLSPTISKSPMNWNRSLQHVLEHQRDSSHSTVEQQLPGMHLQTSHVLCGCAKDVTTCGSPTGFPVLQLDSKTPYNMTPLIKCLLHLGRTSWCARSSSSMQCWVPRQHTALAHSTPLCTDEHNCDSHPHKID